MEEEEEDGGGERSTATDTSQPGVLPLPLVGYHSCLESQWEVTNRAPVAGT